MHKTEVQIFIYNTISYNSCNMFVDWQSMYTYFVLNAAHRICNHMFLHNTNIVCVKICYYYLLYKKILCIEKFSSASKLYFFAF